MVDAGELIPNLPNDVALQCLARVPRSQHPTLSLVCKSWRYTVTSPALFHTRSSLRTTESSLFLILRVGPTFHWYSLFPLIPLPPPPTPTAGPALAVVGPMIYLIGGSHNDVPSNTVWVFDCRFSCWRVGPRMRIGREFAAAGVVDDKIYVMGGCVVDNWARSMNWAEVFDPVTGLWAALPSPIEVRAKWMHASAVVGGRIYAMADRGGVVYDVVGGGEWGSVSKRLDLGWRGRAAVVGGVLYCYDYLGKIRGYDVEEDTWKELRGVEKRLPKFLCGATMVNYDERLCVVWEGKGSGKKVDVMCAVIRVWKDEDGGLTGSVLSSDVVLVVPDHAAIVHCLAVDL